MCLTRKFTVFGLQFATAVSPCIILLLKSPGHISLGFPFGFSQATEPPSGLGAQQFFQYSLDPLVNTVTYSEIVF